MFLKFKNKFQMAIDKMLDDAKTLGGEPDNIIIEPNEAYSMLKEASLNPDAYKGKLSVVKTGSEDENVSLLWISKDFESIKNIVNDWYKLKYKVTYSGVELKIVKTKKEEVPEEIKAPALVKSPPDPPKMPLGRIIKEGSIGVCEECGSSLKYKWFFFKSGGCIQPECENYYKNNDPKQW